ncbi:MAG: aldo/keto reductase [Prevotella sp.]|nr:aldo/keto reductase [Prevotella sp.]
MKNISRRNFFKTLGGTAVASSLLLAACKKSAGGAASAQADGEGTMTLRTNHNTGDKVSLLGFGMMRLPTVNNGGSARETDEEIDQEMVNRLVDYALAHGVNYFDTAPVYCQGKSEHATGIALSRHKRSGYFIATKLSNQNPANWAREASQAMLRNSLKELQTDYIDYLLLHSVGGGEDPFATFNGRFIDNGLLDWLVEQKAKGVIRNLGFSYHGDVRIFDMLLKWHDEGRYHWDFVQIELNYLDWDYAHEINAANTNASYLYAELEKRNIPAVIMEPLLGGRLANVPDYVAKKLQEREPQSTAAGWAFRFAGTPEGVLTVLSGMTYMEHLEENVRTYSPLRPLTDADLALLADVAKDIFDIKAVPCTGCKYCMPCPYGLNIPVVFAHYNKCLNEGNLVHTSGEHDSAYRRARRAFLVGYDRSVPKLRQADHCIGCGQCKPHCPQSIDIPKEMVRIAEYTDDLRRG